MRLAGFSALVVRGQAVYLTVYIDFLPHSSGMVWCEHIHYCLN